MRWITQHLTRLISLTAALLLLFASMESDAEPIDFNREIRPILSNNCFLCHGPDANERKGGRDGLRLDIRSEATQDLGGYAAILPGDANASELIERLVTSDPDDLMPPPESGKTIQPAQIEKLRQWINEGAVYAKHWSYEKPSRPALPEINDRSWVSNEIDVFTLNQLEERNLSPEVEAERAILIRRTYLDLTGIPPSLESLEHFLQDPSPTWYSNLINSLIGSDNFGEHWARQWLDLARYADSAGYADDPMRTIWAYRDYVIDAFNQNKPFDQFTIEQIAGDLLPNPEDEQLVATAFHRNTKTNNEGGTSDEEFRNAAIIDRVNTTYSVWMGTTMACAQCHDHKYDPLSQEDYFRSFAILNNTADSDRRDEAPTHPLYTDEQIHQRERLQSQLDQLRHQFKRLPSDLLSAFNKWQSQLTRVPQWNIARITNDKEKTKVGINLEEGSEVSALKLQFKAPITVSKAADIEVLLPPRPRGFESVRYVRLELPGNRRILSLAEVQVFANGKNIAPLGSANQISTANNAPANLAIDGNTAGNFTQDRSTTHTSTIDNPWWELDLGEVYELEGVKIWNRTDGNVGSRLAGLEMSLLDSDRKRLWSTTLKRAPSPSVTLNPFSEPVRIPKRIFASANGYPRELSRDKKIEQAILTLSTIETLGESQSMTLTGLNQQTSNIKKAEFLASDLAGIWNSLPNNLLRLLGTAEIPKGKEGDNPFVAHFLETTPAFEQPRAERERLETQLGAIRPYTTVPVMQQLTEDRFRKTNIQIRGNYQQLGPEVSPALPTPFVAPTGSPKTRLDLAHWLISEENPLTARVIVNRLWESLFGSGIVSTSEEFGSQGTLPSHPDLLDWLAVEFQESQWNIKHMLKLMVESSTYKQSSRVTSLKRQQDPMNRWYSRGRRFRQPAEAIRDQALFVAGLLSSKRYGPPVKPPQPSLGLNAAFGSQIDWKTSDGEDKYRRGIYTTWRRSNPYPSMVAFDAPNREVCTLKRDKTNTPLQALVTLNDPVYFEAAQSLGLRMAAFPGKLSEQIAFGYRLALSRLPTGDESVRLVTLFRQMRQQFTNNPEEARQLIRNLTVNVDRPAVESASWTVLGNVILNLDEFLMRL